MIRVELEPQTAIELHHAAGLLRRVLEDNGATEQALQMRDAQLAIAGALRAFGWEPDGPDAWRQRARRPRR